jgi:hypothetical protein
MQNLAVPSINDQLTNARARAAKALRLKEGTPFLRLDNIQLAYGCFHKCLNLVWAILKIHQGAVDQLGSLKYFFALLEKTRLANDKPDYHTLLAALMQILHGVLLAAWRQECGFETLDAFAASDPTPDALLDIADRILLNYATPMDEIPPPFPPLKTTVPENISDSDTDLNCADRQSPSPELSPEPSGDGSESSETPNSCDPQDDCAHRNIHILIRDLLYVAELVRAISDGDWGRIEDILGQLTMMFRGAGSNNYSTELLHFLHNLKMVWGEDFA